jgi:D-alanyl-lipoteichoic acid acyltransferase DltB (MBOAT superfamily)
MDFAFYVSFFPQLVAGPIVRASEFVPQIYRKYSVSKEDFGRAILLIITGMIKKILIADYLGANFVGGVFADPEKYTGFQNLLGVYGFALQIYGDFSGYTDIAIGIALLLGFRLPLNFNSPYKAVNITDFWRRWHISLSSWLRDYLYIPLGGNRGGKSKMYRNLFLTMLLGGLWHGAAWRFIFWGAMHGIALAVHKVFSGLVPSQNRSNKFIKIFFGIITFHFVCFCWIFFAAKDMATGFLMLKLIFTNFHPELVLDTIIAYKEVIAVMIIGFVTHLLPINVKELYTVIFIKMPVYGKAIVIVITALLLYQVMSSEIQPFIYFQF